MVAAAREGGDDLDLDQAFLEQRVPVKDAGRKVSTPRGSLRVFFFPQRLASSPAIVTLHTHTSTVGFFFQHLNISELNKTKLFE